jgi:hypothetical protein
VGIERGENDRTGPALEGGVPSAAPGAIISRPSTIGGINLAGAHGMEVVATGAALGHGEKMRRAEKGEKLKAEG